MKKNNAHAHFATEPMIPDKFFKTRSNLLSEKLIISAPFKWTSYIGTLFTKSKRLPEMIGLYKMHVKEQARAYIKEMDEAGIDKAIIIVMDLSQSSFSDWPEWSYSYQLEVMVDICREHDERLYLAPMVDPRRENIEDLIFYIMKNNSKYIKGIKMYPALGYHPDRTVWYNESDYMWDNLAGIYGLLNEIKGFVISHCSKGGAYSDRTMRSIEERNWLSHPKRWEKVLKDYPNIKICLAHFGGDFHEYNINSDFSTLNANDKWSWDIISMMEKHQNLWTDFAYNDKLLLNDTSYQWVANFWNLPDYVYKRMLFGTDWLMTRPRWTEKEYCDTFERNILRYVPTYRYQVCNHILEDMFYRNFFEFTGINHQP